MSRKLRRREYILSSEEVLQLLEIDDSDEEGLFEIDEEDEVLLDESTPERGDDPTTIEIVDHHVPMEKAPANPDSSETMIGASFRWTKRFSKLAQPEENLLNNDVS